MDRTERFYKIQNLIANRRAVPMSVMLDELCVSKATVKRDLEYMRDRIGMPIVWDRELRGYRLDKDDPTATTFELPGLWFSATEVHALLTMEHLMERLQPGLLQNQVRPLRNRIRKLLEAGDHSFDEVGRRIKILQMGARPVEPDHFQVLATSLLSRRQLLIRHFKRQTGETTERTVSPQRLVHYRDNWYLDAWCHWRRGLRTFSVDAISSAEIIGKRARTVTEKAMDAYMSGGYGIFSGKAKDTAILQFNPMRARWVSRERWHSDQEGDFELDGSYILKVPYSDSRELVMDILKYGGDVKVLGPKSLVEAVKAQAKALLALYN